MNNFHVTMITHNSHLSTDCGLAALTAGSSIPMQLERSTPLEPQLVASLRQLHSQRGSLVPHDSDLGHNSLIALPITTDLLVVLRGHNVDHNDRPTGRIDVNVYRRNAVEGADLVAAHLGSQGIEVPPHQKFKFDGVELSRIARLTNDPKELVINGDIAVASVHELLAQIAGGAKLCRIHGAVRQATQGKGETQQWSSFHAAENQGDPSLGPVAESDSFSCHPSMLGLGQNDHKKEKTSFDAPLPPNLGTDDGADVDSFGAPWVNELQQNAATNATALQDPYSSSLSSDL